MMKKFTAIVFLFSFLCGVTNTNLVAQATEFVFVAADLEPQNDGFYKKGLTFNWDGSPNPFFANGCPGDVIDGRVIDPEDYERRDPANVTFELHRESGEAQGFTFKNTMILPDCNHKFYDDMDGIIEPPVSNGFIQLHPTTDIKKVSNPEEDSTIYSYVASPLLSKLTSITIEASADVGPNGNRNIPYYVEASLDSGKTWDEETYFIEGLVDVRSGTRNTYEGADLWGMDEISKEQNIMVRVRTYRTDTERPNSGQFINLHKFTIAADSAFIVEEEEEDTTGNGGTGKDVLALRSLDNKISIDNNRVSAEKGDVAVYSISGQYIGQGKAVLLRRGLYVVITEEGKRRKIFIK